MKRFIALAAIAACGGDVAQPDAGAPIDARPRPDALQCSLGPAPEPPEPRYDGFDVVYDVPLVGSAGRAWTFATVEGAAVFTSNVVARVDHDGIVLSSQPIPDGMAIVQVVQGAGTFAANVVAGVQHSLCVIDALGVLDPDRCDPADGLSSIAFDGTSYVAYLFTKAGTRRVYDADATMLDEQALDVESRILGAVVTPDREDVFSASYADDCYTLDHRVTTSSGVVTEPALPDDVLLRGDSIGVAVGPFGRSFLLRVACRFPDECEATQESTRLLTTYLGETLVAERLPIPISPTYGEVAIARDGDHTVTLHHDEICMPDQESERCVAYGVLTRFDLDGEPLAQPQRVAAELDAGTLFLAIATVAPGDYVIAYGDDSLRLARIRIPL